MVEKNRLCYNLVIMEGIIKQIKEKIKWSGEKIVKFFRKDIVFFGLLIIFMSSISFLLGSLSEFQKEKKKTISEIEFLKSKERENGKEIYFVASKYGKRYYLPWCYSGSEKNKIKFKTKEEAEKKGYTPSKSCEGL